MKTWKQYGVNHTEYDRIGSYAIVTMSFDQPNCPFYLGLFRVAKSGRYDFVCNLRISEGWNTFDTAKDQLCNKAIQYEQNSKLLHRKNTRD